MAFEEGWKDGGKGVLATANVDGTVNTAVYATPHRTGNHTVAWAMTEGRTYRNLLANPNASYLYIAPGDGSQGTRFTLRVREIRDSGDVLDAIRSRAKTTSGEGAAKALRYVAFFDIVEERPLV